MEGLEGLRVNRPHARDTNLQTLQTLHYWLPAQGHQHHSPSEGTPIAGATRGQRAAEARRALARAQRDYQTALAQRYAGDPRITRAAIRLQRAANRLRNTSGS
jgi:hypothetical protein